MSVGDARLVLERAIAARIFPAAAFEFGSGGGIIASEVLGTLTFNPDAVPTTHDTIFDLASLTKPIATTTMAMELVRTGALSLDARAADFFEEWRGADREAVTVRDLLEHSAGLPARLVDQPPQTRREFEHDICTIALEYEPRTRSIYSDLGFILLGFLLERLGQASLAELFDRMMVRLPPSPFHGFGVTGQPDLLTFTLSPADRQRTAPTRPMDDDARRGRMLIGEVHDNYAAALGGVAGHAGLFGTANGVGAFARAMLRAARNEQGEPFRPPLDVNATELRPGSPKSLRRDGGSPAFPEPLSPDLVRAFTTKTTVPGSSRALGWDTMLPTSSCGTRMSPSAFGHVGFTGTSLWIDPGRGLYFVLLTNRACGGGTLDEMRTVRRAFHDALGDV